MQTIILAIIAGLLLINMIDMKYLHFQGEAYIKRIFVVLYWALFTGMIILAVSFLLNLIISSFI